MEPGLQPFLCPCPVGLLVEQDEFLGAIHACAISASGSPASRPASICSQECTLWWSNRRRSSRRIPYSGSCFAAAVPGGLLLDPTPDLVHGMEAELATRSQARLTGQVDSYGAPRSPRFIGKSHSGTSVITVQVRTRVVLPLMPEFLGGDRPSFRLDSAHTVPIGQYQEVDRG